MYKDEERNKIYFKLNILEDFPKLVLKKKNNNNPQDEIFCKVKIIILKLINFYNTKQNL